MLHTFYCCLLSWLCFSLPAWGQARPSHLLEGYLFLSPNCGLPAHINLINMLHSDADSLPMGTQVRPGMVVAHVQELPAIRSAYYGAALAESEAAYEAGRFAEAADLVREAASKEPDNLFILNAFARALYQTNETKPQSYLAYQAFFRAQRVQYTPAANELAVDSWFLEANWKYGTLCLDQAEWLKAVASIEQFLAGYDRMDNPNPELLEQALGYLTEAFFQLHKPGLCRYYGTRTLALYPSNQYVQRYLAALPKHTAKPRK